MIPIRLSGCLSSISSRLVRFNVSRTKAQILLCLCACKRTHCSMCSKCACQLGLYLHVHMTPKEKSGVSQYIAVARGHQVLLIRKRASTKILSFQSHFFMFCQNFLVPFFLQREMTLKRKIQNNRVCLVSLNSLEITVRHVNGKSQ